MGTVRRGSQRVKRWVRQSLDEVRGRHGGAEAAVPITYYSTSDDEGSFVSDLPQAYPVPTLREDGTMSGLWYGRHYMYM